VKIVCLAGSRGERAKLMPVVAGLQSDQNIVCAYVSRTGEVPTWDASAPPPSPLSLEINDSSPALCAGAVLRWMEPLLEEHRPDVLLTCGESDAAVGAALVASFSDVAIAHLDAGLVLDRANPNGRLLDQAATFLLAPHVTAVQRLAALGMEDSAYLCGDTLADAAAAAQAAFASAPGPAPDRYCLCYLGGPALESPALPSLVAGLAHLGMPVLVPTSARARARLAACGPSQTDDFRIVEPLDYAAMQQAIACAALVITDSATLQREAYYLGTVAIGLAPADFPDGESSGWVRRAALSDAAVLAAAQAPPPAESPPLADQRGAGVRAAQFMTGL